MSGDVQYPKNFNPMGLLHTRMHIDATMHEMDMYTNTGQRTPVWSVHVAQTNVETIATAVTPEG